MNTEREIITIEEFKKLVPFNSPGSKHFGDFAMEDHKKQCEDILVGGKVHFFRYQYHSKTSNTIDIIEAEVVDSSNQNQNPPKIGYTKWTPEQLKYFNLMDEE